MWEYAGGGKVKLTNISDDGQVYMFEIKAQIPEGDVDGEFIYEKGGKLVPAGEASEEARKALSYTGPQ